MKRRVLIGLLVLLTMAVGSLQLAAAQDGSSLSAVTLDSVSVYEGPSESGEPVGAVDANTMVTVLGSDPSGAWLQVESGDVQGYVMADQVVVLTPVLLAPSVMVSSNTAGAPLFAAPDMASEFIGTAEYGDMARVLGTSGQFAYVVAPDGTAGWTIASAWETTDTLSPALVELGATDAVGLFAEPNITADLAGTLNQNVMVYATGRTDGSFSEVRTADGTTGWIDSSYLNTLPNTWVDATSGAQAAPALYAEPDFSAEILGTLSSGAAVRYVGDVDEFWIELYSPEYGTVYGLAENYGPVYTTATVQVAGANVRQGPNDETYNVIAQLSQGTDVVVLGTNEAGDWVKVLLPYSEIDYPYRGTEGWMASFLFADAAGESSLDVDQLSVVE